MNYFYTFDGQIKMLEDFIDDTRKSYAAILSVQKISTNPEAYDELLEGEKANARQIKQEITEVLHGQF